MNVEAVAHATIEQEIVEQASAIYAEYGMTLDEAFRLLLVRTATDRAVPFDAFIPNQETIEAMEAGRRGEVHHAGTIEQLFEQLHAND